MKKTLTILLVILLTFMLFAGCGPSTSSRDKNDKDRETKAPETDSPEVSRPDVDTAGPDLSVKGKWTLTEQKVKRLYLI